MRFGRHVVDTSSLFHCCTQQTLFACLTTNQDNLMILLIPLYDILQTFGDVFVLADYDIP